MEAKYTLPNYRLIKVKMMPWTNTLPDRIKIWEEGYGCRPKADSKIFPFDGVINDVAEQGVQILLSNGFTPVCRATEHHRTVILCDDFGDNYTYIKDLTQ